MINYLWQALSNLEESQKRKSQQGVLDPSILGECYEFSIDEVPFQKCLQNTLFIILLQLGIVQTSASELFYYAE